ncbi:hypothetical protein [Streptomyces sp. NBC_00572]|uniref:hypothetical protein n=1 Tax=Streptomyces sp. NBC_00572 TaxID=2903664 RepID=UPI002253348B|nr:hypothetical protein [Streptomyces sp. NBC_00572]MCX4985702.1 hypothetical protein [Streptomyces sp. NBC_00572]
MEARVTGTRRTADGRILAEVGTPIGSCTAEWKGKASGVAPVEGDYFVEFTVDEPVRWGANTTSADAHWPAVTQGSDGTFLLRGLLTRDGAADGDGDGAADGGGDGDGAVLDLGGTHVLLDLDHDGPRPPAEPAGIWVELRVPVHLLTLWPYDL